MGALEHVCYGCNIPGKVAVTARLVTSVKSGLKFWACNVNLETRKLRMLEYVKLAGSKDSGLVSQAKAAWLLDVCRWRVYDLVRAGRLESRASGGELLIFFPSVFRYAKGTERKLLSRVKTSLRAKTCLPVCSTEKVS